MIPSLDIISDFVGVLYAFLFVGLVVGVAIAYALYRALSGLSATERGLIIGGIIIVGILLVVSVAGAPVGVVAIVAGIFTQLFQSLYPSGETEA